MFHLGTTQDLRWRARPQALRQRMSRGSKALSVGLVVASAAMIRSDWLFGWTMFRPELSQGRSLCLLWNMLHNCFMPSLEQQQQWSYFPTGHLTSGTHRRTLYFYLFLKTFFCCSLLDIKPFFFFSRCVRPSQLGKMATSRLTWTKRMTPLSRSKKDTLFWILGNITFLALNVTHPR